ncbi:hypothetical protein [Pseudogulbenkiania sp. MAI-1]|uniref:hypothetical protein n=1 Tax=Pseudogulbenkiania sp. MAI-1 TaxID=990370 RepID=UPI00045E5E26|nr:hypothetical protein [Pseudogulbenkiania sp. MAI-1]
MSTLYMETTQPPSIERALAEALALAEYLAERVPRDVDIPEANIEVHFETTEAGVLTSIFARRREP